MTGLLYLDSRKCHVQLIILKMQFFPRNKVLASFCLFSWFCLHETEEKKRLLQFPYFSSSTIKIMSN